MTSHSNRTDLHNASLILLDEIDRLTTYFNLKLKSTAKMYVGNCPIHDGDKSNALNIYHTGHTYRGNWKCRTRGCEKIFQPTMLGFVRGLLSKEKLNWSEQGDPVYPFGELLKWCAEFLGQKIGEDLEDMPFSTISKIYKPRITQLPKICSKEEMQNLLTIPSKHYLDRYPHDLLIKYDVGLCETPSSKMRDRTIFPVYDENHEYIVGGVGRSIWDKCSDCGSYHNPRFLCPKPDIAWAYSKWKNTTGFRGEQCFYNYWFAKKHIIESGEVILVESQGNVLRLEEAGFHNSLGTFGAHFTPFQKKILDKSGAMSILVIGDPDPAGRAYEQMVTDMCKDQYNVRTIEMPKDKDIADMTSTEIANTIKGKYNG